MPQHQIEPSIFWTQRTVELVATRLTGSGITACGDGTDADSPPRMPPSPPLPAPQQRRCCCWTAQVSSKPIDRNVTSRGLPVGLRGMLRSSVVPSPTCIAPLYPQHQRL